MDFLSSRRVNKWKPLPSREEMVAKLASLLKGAPNYEDYKDWLYRQSTHHLKNLYDSPSMSNPPPRPWLWHGSSDMPTTLRDCRQKVA